MRILVTGGGGFIGSHVVCKLLKAGYSIHILDNFSTGKKRNIPVNERVTLFVGDTRDPHIVDKAVRGCSVIIHLAAIVGVEEVIAQPLQTVEVETIGTHNIVQAAISHGIKKIMYASSSAVYKRVKDKAGSRETDDLGLVSTYAIAKRLNEQYLFALTTTNNISVNCLRFFNIYGARQDTRMVIPRFFDQAVNNRPIEVFGGSQTRDFTAVEDVSEAIYRLLQRPALNGNFNISHGAETTILELATLIKNATGSKSEIVMLGHPCARETFRVNRRIGNNDKLFAATAFRPGIQLTDGLGMLFEKHRETVCRSSV